ncbi:hypothetical protein ABK040_000827 [Willaertia magna]
MLNSLLLSEEDIIQQELSPLKQQQQQKNNIDKIDNLNHYNEINKEINEKNNEIENNNLIKIKIINTYLDKENGLFTKQKTIYEILITFYFTKKISFLSKRRYSEFLDLYKKITKNYTLQNNLQNDENFEEFPEKNYYHRFDEKIVNERKIKFEKILNQFLKIENIFYCKDFREFLNIPVDFIYFCNFCKDFCKVNFDISLKEWNCDNVVNWLKCINLDYFISIFSKNNWDGLFLQNLINEETKEFTISKLVNEGIINAKIVMICNHVKQMVDFQNLYFTKNNLPLDNTQNIIDDNNYTTLQNDDDNSSDNSDNSCDNNNCDNVDNNKKIINENENFSISSLLGSSSSLLQHDNSTELYNEITKRHSLKNSENLQNCDNDDDNPYLPPYDKKLLTNKEKQYINFCKEKLKKTDNTLTERSLQILAQNLTINERLLYLALNPIFLESLQNGLQNSLQQKKRNNKNGCDNTAAYVKLKLIVTELSESRIHRLQRSVAHFLNQVNQEWGYFHTSLVFGPFLIEWTDSSIVTIRPRSSSKAVFAADIYKFKTEIEIDKALHTIVNVICQWNGEKIYSNDKCNCQHFVTNILQELNIEKNNFLQTSQSLQFYLEKLKNDGICKMEFFLNETLQEILQTKKKSVTFLTHKEIDLFYNEILQNDPSYFLTINGINDEALLKAFDRAFWLRLSSQKKIKNNNIPHDNNCDNIPVDNNNCDNNICDNYLPLRNEETGECNCPFNPLEKPLDQVDNSIVGTDYEFGNIIWKRPNRKL